MGEMKVKCFPAKPQNTKEMNDFMDRKYINQAVGTSSPEGAFIWIFYKE